MQKVVRYPANCFKLYVDLEVLYKVVCIILKVGSLIIFRGIFSMKMKYIKPKVKQQCTITSEEFLIWFVIWGGL